MRLEKARDFMIPLDQYAVVDEDATMVEALQALDVAQTLVPEGMRLRSTVLVRDARGAIIGRLGRHALLAGGEPRHLDDVGGSRVHEGYTRKYLLSVLEQAPLWQDGFDTHVQRAMTSRVGDVMLPMVEHVDIDTPIGQVIHKLVVCDEFSLVVTEGDRPVGMLWLADLSSKADKEIKQRATLARTSP
jgi:hypothetical protein